VRDERLPPASANLRTLSSGQGNACDLGLERVHIQEPGPRHVRAAPRAQHRVPAADVRPEPGCRAVLLTHLVRYE